MPRLWYFDGIFLAKSENCNAALAAFSNALSGGVGDGLDTLSLANVLKICEKVLPAAVADPAGTQAVLLVLKTTGWPEAPIEALTGKLPPTVKVGVGTELVKATT